VGGALHNDGERPQAKFFLFDGVLNSPRTNTQPRFFTLGCKLGKGHVVEHLPGGSQGLEVGVKGIGSVVGGWMQRGVGGQGGRGRVGTWERSRVGSSCGVSSHGCLSDYVSLTCHVRVRPVYHAMVHSEGQPMTVQVTLALPTGVCVCVCACVCVCV
jgi:hypothetical protein